MKITYYGTGAGAGIPEIFCSCRVCEYARKERGIEIRTRSQAVIDDRLGVDFPVDVLMHTIYGGLDMRKIRNVLITHNHYDHFLGADAISRPLWEGEPMRFYASEKSGTDFRSVIDNTEKDYREGKRVRTSSYTPEIHFLKMFTSVSIDGYTVTPLRARHAEERDAMLFIIQGEKNVLWLHDTGLLPEDTVVYLKDCGLRFDFVSMDCTLARDKQITQSHMGLDQCIITAQLLRQCGCIDEKTVLVISHIGHLVERTHKELEAEAAPFGFTVAHDGKTYEF
ncbi:MAG: hypothetical protein E7487_11405 [Ruminococcaceae bacterium]|nr:hypothetical protein [Oscillospiraceae bacterium]